MKSNIRILCVFFFIFYCIPIFSQTHISVPMDNQVYFILEQAEIRGLCSPLSGIRPYTQNVVVTAINEILDSENSKLGNTEREILKQHLQKFSKPETGLDWQRGAYYNETFIGKDSTLVSTNIGVSADIQGNAGIYYNDKLWGAEIWLQGYLNGDIGNSVSYNFIFEGGLVKAPRNSLGKYDTYYDTFPDQEPTAGPDVEYVNRKIDVYSEPLTHFPYTYKKRWDGSVFSFDSLSNFGNWPQGLSGGYNLPAELTASFFENKLIMRLGRLPREWGSTSFGSSLAFNQMARPFLGIEADFNPVSWFGIASLTGFLEYSNVFGIKTSAETFQNLFSVTMFQFKYKNYLFFDFVDAVVYPKRFELGYISPITNNFFYQNNIGDFDNMAITLNLKAQYPGLGNFWISFFVDEMNFLSDIWTLDRQMFAWQTGINIPLPFLSFTSIKVSYSKVNPYCYTHNRNFNPWYGNLLMETGYSNNGVGLGYYLPPNADEILFKFSTMPAKNVTTNFQYQLIRHGADFGPSAVDGSNLQSELGAGENEIGRDINPILKRFFLHDGAYQWNHIIKIGIEWNLPNMPVALYSEAGTVISYFTNIDAPANKTGQSHPYKIVNTSYYPKSTSVVANIGVRIYPK